jgi:hypothetical protein
MGVWRVVTMAWQAKAWQAKACAARLSVTAAP